MRGTAVTLWHPVRVSERPGHRHDRPHDVACLCVQATRVVQAHASRPHVWRHVGRRRLLGHPGARPRLWPQAGHYTAMYCNIGLWMVVRFVDKAEQLIPSKAVDQNKDSMTLKSFVSAMPNTEHMPLYQW